MSKQFKHTHWQTCMHEAAHALIALMLGLKIDYMSVEPNFYSAGRVDLLETDPAVNKGVRLISQYQDGKATKQEMLRELKPFWLVKTAGNASDRLHFGLTTYEGSQMDLWPLMHLMNESEWKSTLLPEVTKMLQDNESRHKQLAHMIKELKHMTGEQIQQWFDSTNEVTK